MTIIKVFPFTVSMTRVAVLVLAFSSILLSGISVAGQSGSLDPNFGAGGKVLTTVNNNTGKNWGKDVLIQPDGKIVVAIEGHNEPAGTGTDFYVVRYYLDGSMDESFGTGGISRIAISGNPEVAYSIGLQSTLKIIVAGTSSIGFAAARLHSNGAIDTTFGSGGKVEFKFANKDTAAAQTMK